jgi:hypothetical protein
MGAAYTSANGNPIRLQSQINALQNANPKSTVTGKVLYQNKNISTKSIKEIETKLIQDYANKNGKLPKGNKDHPEVILPPEKLDTNKNK